MSIEIVHLSFAYSLRNVLRDVSLCADEGQLLAVLGPNGVGKTTLFRCILGLQPHYRGTICVDGEDAHAFTPRELAHKIAYIPQTHGIAFSYCVLDMVLMGTTHQVSAMGVPGKKELDAANAALDKLGIQHLKNHNFSKLSGGEQQLVLIARALAQNAKTLLMDEPTASLDYGNQSLVLRQVRKLADDGYTILLSTHNPQHALWYADRAVALLDGTIAAFGSPNDVVDAALIEKLYGVTVRLIDTAQGALISPVIEAGAR
ncbi:MAG: ABC transporter ATP-binding protein [Eubacteriales bacterium]|nr:ABC transporter ATP-binding protein [Eubacteriales bacterium]